MGKILSVLGFVLFIIILVLIGFFFNVVVNAVDYFFSLDGVRIITCLVIISILFFISKHIVARKKRFKVKLLAIFLLFIIFISLFAYYYAKSFKIDQENAFQISSDYELIYNAAQLNVNLKKKKEYLFNVYLFQLMGSKADSVFITQSATNSSLGGIYKCRLTGDLYFEGISTTTKSHEGFNQYIYYFVGLNNKGQAFYSFDQRKLSGENHQLNTLCEEFRNAYTIKDLKENLSQFAIFYSQQINALDTANYNIVAKGQLNLEYTDFLLFSASTMIPITNPGFIPIRRDVKIFMIIQSILGLFLLGYGIEALWEEAKSKKSSEN